MIIAVLRSGHRVQVEIDAQTVLARPGDGAEEVGPPDVGEEGLRVPGLSCRVDRLEGGRAVSGHGVRWRRERRERAPR